MIKYRSKILYTDFVFIRGIGMERWAFAIDIGMLKVVS